MRLLPSCRGVARYALLPLALLCAPLEAHVFDITNVVIVFPGDGSYQIDMSVDADALALGLPPETDSETVVARMNELPEGDFDEAVALAQQTIQRRVRIRFDGNKAMPDVAFPHHGTPAATEAETPTVLGTIARMAGQIPLGARELTFGASRVFKTVDLKIFDPSQPQPTAFLIGVGEDSPPYFIGSAAQPRQNVFWNYLKLGFTHILPKGLDHILFVVGLFLLSPKWKPLLWQVTAFTIAHSVTLALSMLQILSLPSRPVETLIALSIAYVAIENIFTSELKPWRPAVVFGFGLLHGLGFAGVLQELGTPQNQFASALVAFNVGVECGQLSVIGLGYAAVGWFQSKPMYRGGIVIPASLAIAVVGVYWAIERMMG